MLGIRLQWEFAWKTQQASESMEMIRATCMAEAFACSCICCCNPSCDSMCILVSHPNESPGSPDMLGIRLQRELNLPGTHIPRIDPCAACSQPNAPQYGPVPCTPVHTRDLQAAELDSQRHALNQQLQQHPRHSSDPWPSSNAQCHLQPF